MGKCGHFFMNDFENFTLWLYLPVPKLGTLLHCIDSRFTMLYCVTERDSLHNQKKSVKKS